MKVRLVAKSTRPILLHNVQLASPLHPTVKKINELNAMKPKTDEIRLEVARLEFAGSLYLDDDIGPVIPAMNLFACLIEGGRLTRAGKKIERGVAVEEFSLPLLYHGPRTVEELWGNGESEYVDVRSVVVNRGKVDRCRPIFRDWAFEADVLLDTAVIDPSEFTSIAQTAGAMIGIGDYRRMFGRFDASTEPL